MITVKELKKMLRKMPDDLPVGIAHHDNGDGEIAGWVTGVEVGADSVYGDGTECVVIQC